VRYSFDGRSVHIASLQLVWVLKLREGSPSWQMSLFRAILRAADNELNQRGLIFSLRLKFEWQGNMVKNFKLRRV